MKTYDDMDVFEFNNRYKEICDLLSKVVTVSTNKGFSISYDDDIPPVTYNSYSAINYSDDIYYIRKKLDKMVKYCLSNKFCLFGWLFAGIRLNQEFDPYKIEYIDSKSTKMYKYIDKISKVKSRLIPCDLEFRVIEFWLNNEEATNIEKLLIARALYSIRNIRPMDVKKPEQIDAYKHLIDRVKVEYEKLVHYLIENELYAEMARTPMLEINREHIKDASLDAIMSLDRVGHDIGYLDDKNIKKHIDDMISTYSSCEDVMPEKASPLYIDTRLLCSKELWRYCWDNAYRMESFGIAIAAKELAEKFGHVDKWKKMLGEMLERSEGHVREQLPVMANSYVNTYNNGVSALNSGAFREAYKAFDKCATSAKWLNHFGIKMDGVNEFNECKNELRDCSRAIRDKDIRELAERMHYDYHKAEMYYQQELDRMSR